MRGGIPISRMNGTYGSEIDSRQKRVESIDWNRFAQDLNQETAVSKARKREAQSLIDQINAIVGNKKQSSVEEKLNSYKERTGLAQFQRIAQAQTQNLEIPQHLQDKIILFLKNRIETFKGHISLLSLQEELLKVFFKRRSSKIRSG
jgi:paraquat-inducible protein B